MEMLTKFTLQQEIKVFTALAALIGSDNIVLRECQTSKYRDAFKVSSGTVNAGTVSDFVSF